MDRCYINLAIVEHFAMNTSRAEEDDATQKASSFSLLARLKTESPVKAMGVTLPTLFKPCTARGDQDRRLGRILIRGRAGVGKTTLPQENYPQFFPRRYVAGLQLWFLIK
jgi:hypothetical protein